MKDEEDHIDFLKTQLDLIERIGLELYTQKHVGGLKSEARAEVSVVWPGRSASTRFALPGRTKNAQ